ncbi:HAD-IIIC family phosphatase [Kitasatospora sp. NPDC057692]|uniref:HAD-IIIC family phosphatase n=1 Tax=Kitasatospora sp. NPDC057692 TaxID=3346215 RepID=UPI003693C76D
MPQPTASHPAPAPAREGASPATADQPDPMARFQALQRAGRLAEDYPQVRELLTDLEDADLLRAGNHLARLAPDEVRKAHPGVPALRVAVTGHGTLSALVPPLTAELARHGVLLDATVSDFDSYVFDLTDPGSDLYAAEPDLVLCVLDPRIVLDELPSPWGPADVERVLAEKTGLIERLAERFTATGRGTLVLNTLPLTRALTAQVVDHRSRALVGALWREANARLLRLGASRPGVVVVDLDPLVAEGLAVADPRLSLYTKAHLSSPLLARYAREIGHLARTLVGRAKKALVLDLDETVWGGILGEDGFDGIEVAETYRGEAFRAFQKVVRQVTSQGVLLAAVSKNDLDPVREVLGTHPQMVLREGDFVRVVANWRPKHENLKELAADLNLGVDSFVFADDSPYECGLVRRELPGVAVLRLDTEPALHVEKLLRDGWFDVLELTAEDRSRATTYREELERKDFLDTFDSLDDYLRELDVTVRFAAAEDRDVPRLAQITQRTNQFNLTTERLQQSDVRALCADPDALVLTVHSRDRFGENGLVGAVLARQEGGTATIDNFLLSCRVFSRGIEQACLSALLRHFKDSGAAEVLGTYRRTAKNGKVRGLYPLVGFTEVSDDGTTAVFRHDLAEIPAPPPYVLLHAELPGLADPSDPSVPDDHSSDRPSGSPEGAGALHGDPS